MLKRKSFVCLLIVGLLAACRSQPAPTPSPIPAPTETAVSVVQPTQPAATIAPTPSPTPILPQISVSDQAVAADGRVFFEQVIAPESGWLAVLAANEGEKVLGYTAVAPGLNESVTVTIDPLQASPELTAVLLNDAGEAGAFEFPGADEPMTAETAVADFTITIEMPLPSITVTDQTISEAGQATIAEVVALEPGWLLIHADADGAIGELLGFTRVEAGKQANLVVPLQWRQATPRLYAVLHQDAERPNRMDGVDVEPVVVVNGSPIVSPFSVSLPLDVFVLDQPVVDGNVVVERVVVNDPAWLVIYFDDEGLPGRIIGFAPLQPGVNERIEAPIVETAVTSPLHILIHEDTKPGDDFDFPANDPPLRVNGQFQNSITFATNPGSYFLTSDQVWEVNEAEQTAVVTVPLVVLDRNVWLVIYNDVDGAAAELVGRVALPPGIHRNVPITIDLDGATDLLHAALHRDEDEIGEFEFPDGVDTPFGGSANLVQSPFSRITSSATSD